MLKTCCELMQKAYQLNWITSRDGNISVRNRDREHFWITPSGIRKPMLDPDMWKKVSIYKDYEEFVVMDHTALSSNLEPSGETPLHYGIQKNISGDCSRVVVHFHPTYIVAALHKGIELDKLVLQFPELGRYTKVGKSVPDVPPISQELADRCHENLGLKDDGSIECDIVGIKGHGVVSIAETPWEAFEHIERLEHICKIVLVGGV